MARNSGSWKSQCLAARLLLVLASSRVCNIEFIISGSWKSQRLAARLLLVLAFSRVCNIEFIISCFRKNFLIAKIRGD